MRITAIFDAVQHEEQLSQAVEGRQMAIIWACTLWQQLQTAKHLLADQVAQCYGAAAVGSETQGSAAENSTYSFKVSHASYIVVEVV